MTSKEQNDQDRENSSEELTEESSSNENESTDSNGSSENNAIEKVEPKWEVLLQPTHESEPPYLYENEPAVNTSKYIPWIRALIPLLILVLYFGYKVYIMEPKNREQIFFTNDEALTNSEPPEIEEDLSRSERRELETLIGQLDYLQQSRSWDEIMTKVEQTPKTFRDNPEVQLYELLARNQLGQKNRALIERLRKIRPYFLESGEDAYIRRIDYLEAKMLTDISITETVFIQNAPRIKALIAKHDILTEDMLRLRLRLARRFEDLGDKEFEASGSFRRDQINLSNARSHYQQALRWVTTEDGWLDLQPIHTGEAFQIIERLSVKIKKANTRFHGPTLPFGSYDSQTWTGSRNDPIHDRPGGTW